MKKKWWIILIVLVLLIGGGIAWCFISGKQSESEMLVVDDEKSECEKEYEHCLEKEARGEYIDCIPCGVFNYIE